jgi:cytochrome c-type biogenesis protein CcsB
MSVVIFIGFALRYDLWLIGGLVQALAAGFLAYALTWDEGYLPAVPALQSYWIKIHVPLVVSSYAAFMVAFVLGVLYLIKHYGAEVTVAEGNAFPSWLASLPSLAQIDIMMYRVVAIGLPLLTVGIITGALWAKEAWGAYWQWDPKETAALLSWIVYMSYMHLHTRNAWRGMRSAWIVSFGFLTILFCYLGVNIWISGLHSYKL